MRNEIKHHQRRQMGNEKKYCLIPSVLIHLALSTFLVACVPDPVPPPAPSDLEERNRALEELKKQLTFMQQGTPQQLLELLDHRDFRVRARAARRLGELGDASREAVPGLTQKLTDEEREVRIETAMALGAIGDKTTISPLLVTMVDQERKVRFWGWKAIRQFGADAYPLIVQNLKPNSVYADRYYLNDAGKKTAFQTELRNRLVSLGDAVVPYLTATLSEEDTAFHQSIIKTLAGFGNKSRNALPALADVLDSSDDRGSQIAVIRAMKKIGDLDPVVIPSLTKVSLSPDAKVAKEAKSALKKLR